MCTGSFRVLHRFPLLNGDRQHSCNAIRLKESLQRPPPAVGHGTTTECMGTLMIMFMIDRRLASQQHPVWFLRGGTFTLGPRVHTEGDSEPVTAKDYGIRILLQVLTAGEPCCPHRVMQGIQRHLIELLTGCASMQVLALLLGLYRPGVRIQNSHA